MIFSNLNAVSEWRKTYGNQSLVLTNGCFDILHYGHLDYLERARSLGNFLLVGINSDDSVSTLKGQGRPINPLIARLHLVEALRVVDGVVPFDSTHATDFIRAARPQIYVKGADYNINTMDQADRYLLESMKADIIFLPFMEGFSTTTILNKIKK